MLASKKGFTLIESLVSVIVLILLIGSTLMFFSQSAGMNSRSREITIATFLAQDKIEEIKGTPFNVVYRKAPKTYKEKILADGKEFMRKLILTVEDEMLIKIEVEVITKKGSEIHLVTYKRCLPSKGSNLN